MPGTSLLTAVCTRPTLPLGSLQLLPQAVSWANDPQSKRLAFSVFSIMRARVEIFDRCANFCRGKSRLGVGLYVPALQLDGGNL